MSAPPRIGERLWTTRAGAEGDLVEELSRTQDATPRVVGGALVASADVQTGRERSRALAGAVSPLSPTFARQGMRVDAVVEGGDDVITVRTLDALGAVKGPVALHVWVPDTDDGNRLAPRASAIEARVRDALRDRLERRVPREMATLVQLALLRDGLAVIGAEPLSSAHSPWPGGRARMKVSGDRPSRAARKVEEALALFGTEPGAGELCVDLGAAPGGWTWALVQRRARVIAVDPAELRPDLRRNPRVRHVKESAFDFAPDAPVDWLFCDMAWRPLEVAQLLAKWGRRGWTRLVVANVKLPMKKKAAMVDEVRGVLAKAGFTRLVTRQLYHDRDEITVLAARV